MGLESKPVCALLEPFLPFCPGIVFPEVPSCPPTGNQEAEGPHLCLLGSHRASFLLFYLHCSEPAGPSPMWPDITRPARPWERHTKEGTTPPEKGPLWACSYLQDPGVPRSRVPHCWRGGLHCELCPTPARCPDQVLNSVFSHPHPTLSKPCQFQLHKSI